MTRPFTRPHDLVVDPLAATLNLQATPADEEGVIVRPRPAARSNSGAFGA